MQQLKDADEHQWVKRDQAIWQFLSLTITLDPPRAAVVKNAAGVVIHHLQPLPAAIYPSHQFVGLMSFMNPIATVEIIEETLGGGDSITIDRTTSPRRRPASALTFYLSPR